MVKIITHFKNLQLKLKKKLEIIYAVVLLINKHACVEFFLKERNNCLNEHICIS